MTTIGAEGGAVKVMGIDVGKTRLDASAEGGPVRCCHRLHHTGHHRSRRNQPMERLHHDHRHTQRPNARCLVSNTPSNIPQPNRYSPKSRLPPVHEHPRRLLKVSVPLGRQLAGLLILTYGNSIPRSR